jgi:transcriptional regulator with XRE-family HTH domain
MPEIHELIKNERIKAGLSEEDMAKRLKIPRSTYQYWEENTPKIDKIKAVAKALGYKEDYFFGKNDDNFVPDAILSQGSKTVIAEAKSGEPSAMQILDRISMAFVDQAKAIADQAEGFRAQAEAFRAQTELIKEIRKEMARQDSQARIESNLNEVLTGVETIADRQGDAIKQILSDLSIIKLNRNGPSKD